MAACRLADPRRMAAAVLGTSVDQVGAEIAKGRNKAVKRSRAHAGLRRPISPHGRTRTARSRFFDDVYGRDDYMRKAMDATRAARQVQS